MGTVVAFVVAMDRNRLIGADGGLPWRLPADLRWFREVTMGKPLLMGRATWESLPRRPLPGRRNLVLTRNAAYQAEGAEVVMDPEAAITLCAHDGELAVIGGAAAYAALLPRAARLYITFVDGAFVGDTWFPPWDEREWTEVHEHVHPADERNAFAMRFVVLERRRGA